jgi:DNA-directed RNA polymerase subunit M/transcription elongation factor TFIIS
MATEFSKSKHVQNAVDQFKKHGRGKAIFFNCNIEHSNLVTNALIEAGFNARHIDANSKDRKEALEWLKMTPNAIICNVGILTAGFDEPSVETIVMNRSTLSLPLWIQCTGRGSRPYPGKSTFTIIDLGANVMVHGDWCEIINWEDMFHNPPKKSDKVGVAPVKDCPKCEAILSASTMVCKYCGYEFPTKEEVYDAAPVELIVHVRPVQELIEQGEGKKEYYSFFMIGNSIVTQAKYKTRTMSDTQAQSLLDQYHNKAKEWCHVKNKKFNHFHSNLAKEHLYKELKKTFPQWQTSYPSIQK